MLSVADKKYTLRIPEELHSRLEEQARKDRRSLHQQMLVMLQDAVERAQRAQRATKSEEEDK